MGSTPQALTARDALVSALKAIDGTSTVSLLGDSWTYNYNLSSSVYVGGDPRAGVDSAAAWVQLDSVDYFAGPAVGQLTARFSLIILARVSASANTSTARQDAALKLAGDIVAALALDRSLGGTVIDVFDPAANFVVETRDGNGLEEWSEGAGFVRVLSQPFWCGRLG